MKLLQLIFLISVAYGIVAGEKVDDEYLERILNITRQIRKDIQLTFSKGEANVGKYSKLYRNTYAEMVQYTKDNWSFDLLNSEATDNIVGEKFKMLSSLKTDYENVKREQDGFVVRIICKNIFIPNSC